MKSYFRSKKYFEVVLFYPYNFWIKFSISDHCVSQQVQRFAKIRRIWSNFPILACTKAELRYIMFSVCYSDTPSNQGFFKRQLFWDLPCLEENNFSPKKTVEVTFMRQRKRLQRRGSPTSQDTDPGANKGIEGDTIDDSRTMKKKLNLNCVTSESSESSRSCSTNSTSSSSSSSSSASEETSKTPLDAIKSSSSSSQEPGPMWPCFIGARAERVNQWWRRAFTTG